MTSLTSQIPQEEYQREIAPQHWRLSVGERRAGGKGTQNLGFWRLKKRIRVEKDVVYAVDEPYQARLAALVSEEKPKHIPCCVIGNPIPDPSRPGQLTIPESIAFREIAMYGKNVRLCYCNNPFDAQPTATRVIREKAQGEDGQTYERIVGKKIIPCPLDACKYRTCDPPQCKNDIVVNLELPWTQIAGAVAKYHTTGMTAWDSIVASLLHVATITGGWLTLVPLVFLYEEKKLSSGRWVPAPRFYFAGDDQKLLKSGSALAEVYLGTGNHSRKLKQLQAHVVSSTLEILEDPDEQRETAGEFWQGNKGIIDADFTADQEEAAPEAAVESPPAFALPLQTEGSLTEKMDALGEELWPQEKQKAAIAGLKSMADAGKLAQQLVAALKAKNTGKVEQLQMGGEKDA